MKRAVMVAMALSMLAGSVAMADARHDRNDRHDRRAQTTERYSRDRHDDRREWRDDRRDRHYDNRRVYRYRVSEYRRPWGYRQSYWHRGDRLPVAYYGRPYRLYDYPRYGLRHPPRGYHWVRVNHDAVLAVIATGLVLDVVYNSFY